MKLLRCKSRYLPRHEAAGTVASSKGDQDSGPEWRFQVLTRAKALRPKLMKNDSMMKTSATSASAYVGVRRREMVSPSTTTSPSAMSQPPSEHRSGAPILVLEERHRLPTLPVHLPAIPVRVPTGPVTVPSLTVTGPAVAANSTSRLRPIKSIGLSFAAGKSLLP